ncbi:DNase1 protein [Ophiocordyceps camponoti-floridani]|uniref:DNase1 protein n=1 Tax=Ophiocordyceps camponoti-floridani TaxID=2030778 RepID=A0A8H4Q194_9HYPO|nr:DNase1 protein [Ophiocordyceps camponoti-floridani]
MAATSQAATVTFWTLDQAQRTVYFTSNPGSAQMTPLQVSGQQNSTVTFPDNWAGNFYAVQNGGQNKPGMLGEVQFSGWLGKTYFDVSAIVDGSDRSNVKQMWPKTGQTPMSGCEVFPCNNCYWLPDDIQTKVTDETDLVTTLGSGQTGISFTQPHQEAPGSAQSHPAPQYQPTAQNPPPKPAPAKPAPPAASPPYKPVQRAPYQPPQSQTSSSATLEAQSSQSATSWEAETSQTATSDETRPSETATSETRPSETESEEPTSSQHESSSSSSDEEQQPSLENQVPSSHSEDSASSYEDQPSLQNE